MRHLLTALLLASPAAADSAQVVADHIRPGYQAFADSAAALAAIESCDADTLRPAFDDAYDAWLAVAHLNLGPAEDEGRSLAILFWPDPKGLGAKAQRALLTGDPAMLTPAFMAQQSVAARGLAGLERLLYPADPLPADPCPLIHATADDLARMAAQISTGWAGFGDLLLTAGDPGNPRFLTENEATQALFTQLATGLEYIADRRLGRPLGTFDKPQPSLAEARASGRSQRNVSLSLQALRDLAQTLAPDNPKTLAAFDHALDLATKLDDPTFAGVSDPQGRLKVEILQQAIRDTRDTAIAEIGPALGVTLGFNSQDGD
jgi:predicted lipoprotein